MTQQEKLKIALCLLAELEKEDYFYDEDVNAVFTYCDEGDTPFGGFLRWAGPEYDETGKLSSIEFGISTCRAPQWRAREKRIEELYRRSKIRRVK